MGTAYWRKDLKTLLVILVLSVGAFAQGICPPNPAPGKPQVCVRWSAAPLANIYRATTPGAENYALLPLAVNVASPYIDSTVLPSTNYYYTAVQLSGGVSSAPSSEAGVLIPVPSAQPQNLVVSVQ